MSEILQRGPERHIALISQKHSQLFEHDNYLVTTSPTIMVQQKIIKASVQK